MLELVLWLYLESGLEGLILAGIMSLSSRQIAYKFPKGKSRNGMDIASRCLEEEGSEKMLGMSSADE